MISQEEFYTLNIGDQVKIVDEWPMGKLHYRDHPISEYLGKVMTIRTPTSFNDRPSFHMEEDYGENGGDGYYWYADMIDYIVTSKTIEPMSMDEIMQLFGGDTE